MIHFFWQFIIVNSRQGLCPEGIPFYSKETRVLKNKRHLTLFRMGFFGAADKWEQGMAKNPILHKICQPYPTMVKLDTLIPYLRRIQKLYESRDIPLGFCWLQYFFTGNQQILLYQEIQIQFPFRFIISNSSKFFLVFQYFLNKHGHNFDDVSKNCYSRPS